MLGLPSPDHPLLSVVAFDDLSSVPLPNQSGLRWVFTRLRSKRTAPASSRLITGDREMELLGRYEENAYLWRMLKLVGHPSVRLHEFQGFDHCGMAEPAFPLLLKEVAARTKALTAGK